MQGTVLYSLLLDPATLNPRLVNASMKAKNAKTENVSSHMDLADPSPESDSSMYNLNKYSSNDFIEIINNINFSVSYQSFHFISPGGNSILSITPSTISLHIQLRIERYITEPL